MTYPHPHSHSANPLSSKVSAEAAKVQLAGWHFYHILMGLLRWIPGDSAMGVGASSRNAQVSPTRKTPNHNAGESKPVCKPGVLARWGLLDDDATNSWTGEIRKRASERNAEFSEAKSHERQMPPKPYKSTEWGSLDIELRRLQGQRAHRNADARIGWMSFLNEPTSTISTNAPRVKKGKPASIRTRRAVSYRSACWDEFDDDLRKLSSRDASSRADSARSLKFWIGLNSIDS